MKLRFMRDELHKSTYGDNWQYMAFLRSDAILLELELSDDRLRYLKVRLGARSRL